ncbi:MAG: ribonuclease H-like domain-containing protein [Bryobacteraceae bacterium]|nr:ribonuclease H-like domain-containing protein [Bryobacteraceae bacterium]
MNETLRKQLELLRRKIARIEAREPRPSPPAALPKDLGREVETPLGRHWEIERRWPAHHLHGSADVGALADLPAGLLAALSEEAAGCAPHEWVFLDTETTGVSGGSGTFAFLVGAGSITPQGFVLRQFFLREPGEEPSMLAALAAHLGQFRLVVTYNGKAFDLPLLETRYRLARQRPPFAHMVHVDLLHAARRLWRLALDSCRLMDLEARILGFEREGDPGGAMVPRLYLEYLRTRNFRPLIPVFSHNAYDILSLACLTAIVPAAFRDPSRLANAAEMAALARWFHREGMLEEALCLLEAALRRQMPEALLWEALWLAAEIDRKLGRMEAAVARWSELSTIANPYQAQALERLAIHYEHREKNPALALEMALAAQAIAPSPELDRRIARLRAKARVPRPPRLL